MYTLIKVSTKTIDSYIQIPFSQFITDSWDNMKLE